MTKKTNEYINKFKKSLNYNPTLTSPGAADQRGEGRGLGAVWPDQCHQERLGQECTGPRHAAPEGIRQGRPQLV